MALIGNASICSNYYCKLSGHVGCISDEQYLFIYFFGEFAPAISNSITGTLWLIPTSLSALKIQFPYLTHI